MLDPLKLQVAYALEPASTLRDSTGTSLILHRRWPGQATRGLSITDDKVDSTQEIVASPGALQNVTSYLNGALANLSNVLQDSNGYILETLGVPPTLVYSSLAVLVAVPLTMSRYGWSIGREQVSPYGGMSSGVPAVTDEDFSYITSQDLDDASNSYYPRSASAAPPAPEDDVLLVKNKGITYPAHFPAYAIGDGKLRVLDVKDRVAVLMDIPSRAARRIKLLYKGQHLKDPVAPVREYGVKNNSELMAVLPELDEASSPSEEEMVIVDAPREDSKSRNKKKNKKRNNKKKGEAGDGSSAAASSPRGSNSTLGTPKSPPPPSNLTGPMKVLYDLKTEFDTKWLPLCDEFTARPPSDPKKCEDEHRKLSETIMLQIVLKLDGVESDGNPEVRGKRRELVQQVQAALKRLDVAKDS
ncbi:hypothetical protein G7Z17_g12601 [Cylindrodendrum hubeiense]|uniref:BAG domain-containing protein n=1 Tax=Cylindrodendrum hubeiense TaxID=595255 RepID=A0A9P5GV64_9HYPO|nr:hypothetical protein G7Z17_g12601 [Cylindrodendrum hubeiense]